MAVVPLLNLRERAAEIARATVPGENSAAKVGVFVRDVIDTLAALPPEELANFDEWNPLQEYEYDLANPTKVAYEGRLYAARRASLNAPPDEPGSLDWREVSGTHAQNTDRGTELLQWILNLNANAGNPELLAQLPGVMPANLPAIRFNATTNKWEHASNRSGAFEEFGAGGGGAALPEPPIYSLPDEPTVAWDVAPRAQRVAKLTTSSAARTVDLSGTEEGRVFHLVVANAASVTLTFAGTGLTFTRKGGALNGGNSVTLPAGTWEVSGLLAGNAIILIIA